MFVEAPTLLLTFEAEKKRKKNWGHYCAKLTIGPLTSHYATSTHAVHYRTLPPLAQCRQITRARVKQYFLPINIDINNYYWIVLIRQDFFFFFACLRAEASDLGAANGSQHCPHAFIVHTPSTVERNGYWYNAVVLGRTSLRGMRILLMPRYFEVSVSLRYFILRKKCNIVETPYPKGNVQKRHPIIPNGTASVIWKKLTYIRPAYGDYMETIWTS